jgi:MFS family permease
MSLARAVVRLTRLDRLERRANVDDRAVVSAFTARFLDELLSGMWTVLAPTFRRVFGLSLIEVGLLFQVVEWTALAVEPLAASTIDHSSRRRLVGLGAAAITAATAVMAAAPSYSVLLLGFAAYALGSGPLCHTADVVVLESFPGSSERAYSRATILDTFGAMAGPAVVAVVLSVGWSWRWALAIGCATGVVYSVTASRASFPSPPRRREDGESLVHAFVSGLRSAVAHREIRRALLVLFAFDTFEAAFILKYVWLHDDVGLSEPLVATWALAEQAVAVAALVLLDRRLRTQRGRTILNRAALALVALPALWVLVPSIAGKVLVGIPLVFVWAAVWPLAKAQSLTVDPNLAGATQAVSTLFPILPLALLETWLARSIGIGPAMALTAAAGAAAIAALTFDRSGEAAASPPPVSEAGTDGSPA